MVDREKVVAGLGEVSAYFRSSVAAIIGGTLACDAFMRYADAAEGAIVLLKEQEAVKPIVDKNISTGESDDPWGRLFFCGACGKRINEKYNPDEYDKYCKHCGQAVKWE